MVLKVAILILQKKIRKAKSTYFLFLINSLFIKLLAHKTMEKNVILEITIGYYFNFKYQ